MQQTTLVQRIIGRRALHRVIVACLAVSLGIASGPAVAAAATDDVSDTDASGTIEETTETVDADSAEIPEIPEIPETPEIPEAPEQLMSPAADTLADSPGGTINIALASASPQPSGSLFDYLITFSCAGAESLTCENVTISIPLDPTTTPSMVPTGQPVSDRWTYQVFGSPELGTVTTSTQGNDQIITIGNARATGSSHTVRFRVTPPNGSTANGTSWELDPTLRSSSFAAPIGSGTVAEGEATATAAILTSKVLTTGTQTVVQPGQKLTYRLTATCHPSVWIELGHLYLQSARIVDALPAGLTIVAAETTPGYVFDPVARTVTWAMPARTDLPVTCGGPVNDGGGIAGDRYFFLTVTVDADVTEGQPLRNTVVHAGLPVGAAQEIEATTSLDLTVKLAPNPWPGGASRWVGKVLIGTIGTNATYAGNWITPVSAAPRDDTQSVEANFDVTVNYDALGFRTRVVDPMPCLDNETSSGVYASRFGTACANPAFHPTVIAIMDWTTHASNDYPAAYAAGWRPRLLLTDGSTVDLAIGSPNVPLSAWLAGATFPVPEGLRGRVAGVILDPDDAIAGSGLRLRISGYADASLDGGDRLDNTAEVTPYRPNGDEADAPVRVMRSLGILAPAVQIGTTKTVSAAQVAPASNTQFTLQTVMNSPLAIPGPLVITDPLPAGFSYRGAVGAVSVSVTRNGQAVGGVTATVELVPDVQGTGRQLVRVTVSPPTGDAFSAGYWNVAWVLPVTAPAIAGSAVNTGQAFLPQATISSTCYRGAFSTDNALDLDGSGDLQAPHCEASAAIRVVSQGAPSFAVTKTVQGDLDPAPRVYPHVGVTTPVDGSVEYTLTWTNTGGGTLTDVVVYDVLPFVGDTAVLSPTPRNSAFQPVLVSIGSPAPGVALSYSTSERPCQPEITAIPDCDYGTWTSTPPAGGLAEVRSLRLTASGSYESGQGFSLAFRMSVPDLDSSGPIAWNNTTSHAWYAAPNGPIALEPTESPMVGLQGSSPSIAISKTDAAGHEGDDPEDPVDVPVGRATELRLTITNTGNNPLRDLVVTDRVVEGGATVTGLRCDFDGDGQFDDGTEWAGPLALGASVSCRADLSMLELEELHGDIARVEAVGTLLDEPVSAEDPFHAITRGTAGIALVKRVFTDDANEAPGPYLDAGSEVEWFYEVTLADGADLPLGDVSVVDDNGTPDDPSDDWSAEYVGGDTDGDGLLDPGETWLFATPAEHRAVAVEGAYGNEAVASGEWAPGRRVTATDPAHYFGAAPAISIEKLVNGTAQHAAPGIEVAAGGELRFEFLVENTGNVTLTDVRVTDDRIADAAISCTPGTGNTIGTLDPGETARCAATLTAPQSPTAQQHVNVATATGVGPETLGPDGERVPGTRVTDTSDAYARVLAQALSSTGSDPSSALLRSAAAAVLIALGLGLWLSARRRRAVRRHRASAPR